MNEVFASSITLGIVLTIFCFWIGLICQKKFAFPLANPMLIGITLIIVFLVIFDVDYESYNKGGQYLTYLLTPATVSLAIPLYERILILKKHFVAIVLGILSGVLANALCILVLSKLFSFNHEQYVTLLPKSITTAIAMGLAEELGGMVTITIVAITMTGLLGNVFGKTACRVFHIVSPISQGLAIGNASHAIGTSKAMEMGEIQGAMGGLAIVVAGLSTTICASVFAGFL